MNGQEIINCQATLDWLYPQYFAEHHKEHKHLPNAHGQVDVAQVRQALGFIPADDYKVWLDVGMALKAAGLDCELWDWWSARSDKYVQGECANKWATFNGNGTTLGTLFYYAKKQGFRYSAEATPNTHLANLAAEIAAGQKKLTDLDVELTLKAIQKGTEIGITSLRTSLKAAVAEMLQAGVEQENYSEADMQAAVDLLKQPNLFTEFYNDFKLTGYRADIGLATTGLLFLGRTQLPASSSLYCFGKTSSGKSEFIMNTAKFFPQHRVLNLTKITPRFLYRAGGADGKALVGKILIFGEMRPLRTGEDDEMQEAIRQFVSENKLSLGSVDDAAGQRNVATTKIAYGPVTMAFTGTRSPSEWDDQIINRSFCQHFKHDQQSIQHILTSKATTGSISCNPLAIDGNELARAQCKWRVAFGLLIPHGVHSPAESYPSTVNSTIQRSSSVTSVHTEMQTVTSQANSAISTLNSKCSHQNGEYTDTRIFSGVEIPFLPQLIFKKKRLTEPDMRAFDLLKSCIAVSALLHQRSRQTIEADGKIILVATLEDYLNIKDAYLEMVPRTSQGISNDMLEMFMNKLLPWWDKSQNRGKALTKSQIAAALAVNMETAKRWIYAWCNADLLDHDTSTFRNPNDRKSYYFPAKDYRLLARQIKKQGDPNIGDVSIPAGTVQPVTPDSQVSGTGQPSDCSHLAMTGAEQLVSGPETRAKMPDRTPPISDLL